MRKRRSTKVTAFKSSGKSGDGNQSVTINTEELLNEGNLNNSQYSDKPITPGEDKYVIQDLQIQSVKREALTIDKFRQSHQSADNRYYFNRVWLYDIFDDILVDGHLSGIIEKRHNTVLNKRLKAVRADKEVEEYETLLPGLAFRKVCKAILETIFWGISGIEYLPGKEFHPRIIPRKHINTKDQLITIQQGGTDGVDYTNARNIMVMGEPDDLGLLLKCAAYVIYKRHGLGDWAQYISIFGQPIRVMKYNTTDQQAKIELKKTLNDSGAALALMIPSTVDFQLYDKQSNGDGKLQETFHNMCNKEMSVICLSNTETTTHDGKTGTGGKSQVHKDQQDEITKSDMHYMLSILNSEQFKVILKMYGYPVDGVTFTNTEEISIEYLAERIKIDTLLIQNGLPIDDDYFYDTYGIPKPENYEELKAKMEEMNTAIQEQLNGPGDEGDDQPPAKKKKPASARRGMGSPNYRPVSKMRNLINAFQAFFPPARW